MLSSSPKGSRGFTVGSTWKPIRSANRWRMEKVTVTTTARMKTGAESLEAMGKSSLSQGEDLIGLVGRDWYKVLDREVQLVCNGNYNYIVNGVTNQLVTEGAPLCRVGEKMSFVSVERPVLGWGSLQRPLYPRKLLACLPRPVWFWNTK